MPLCCAMLLYGLQPSGNITQHRGIIFSVDHGIGQYLYLYDLEKFGDVQSTPVWASLYLGNWDTLKSDESVSLIFRHQ